MSSPRHSSPSICCATATTTCAILPLTERRKRLEALFKKHPAPSSELVRHHRRNRSVTAHALLEQAKAENWEGLMVKLARSPYRTAKRSPEWMKYKLNKQDEFVVVRLDRSRRHARAFRIADPRRARQRRTALRR